MGKNVVVKVVALPLSEYTDAELHEFIAKRSQMVASQTFWDGEPIADDKIGYFEQSIVEAKAELEKRGKRNAN